MFGKRGLSDVVSTVLIILLVVAAVAGIWLLVKPLLDSGGDAVQGGVACLSNYVEPIICKNIIDETRNYTIVSYRKIMDNQVSGINNVSINLEINDGIVNSYNGNENITSGAQSSKISIPGNKIAKKASIVAEFLTSNGRKTSCSSSPIQCQSAKAVDLNLDITRFEGDPSLLVWVRGDVNSSGSFMDSSNYKRNIINSGGATQANGKIGQAISLMSGNYLNLSDAGFPSGNSPRTVSAWIILYPGSFSQIHMPIFAYGTPSNGAASGLAILSTNGGAGGISSFFGYGGNDLGGTSVGVANWYNIVGVYNGTKAKIYVNGTLVNSGDKNWNTILSGVSHIGTQVGFRDNSEKFIGMIDEVMLFNRTLSDNEIATLYNAGR